MEREQLGLVLSLIAAWQVTPGGRDPALSAPRKGKHSRHFALLASLGDNKSRGLCAVSRNTRKTKAREMELTRPRSQSSQRKERNPGHQMAMTLPPAPMMEWGEAMDGIGEGGVLSAPCTKRQGRSRSSGQHGDGKSGSHFLLLSPKAPGNLQVGHKGNLTISSGPT